MSDDCNAIMKIIKGRRSIRRFKSKPVEREKIETLLEAARWAPSAGNAQPWDFIIITDSRTIQGLKTVMTGVMGNMKEGPVLILVCSNRNSLVEIRHRVCPSEHPPLRTLHGPRGVRHRRFR
jgi:nitroreductase